ncbi:MAG: signal recognition particle-docking protein FtsY [Candidatus Competibacteraceae bacterium]|nr:signal recognition particle-docking protein FtsY [Candidatus Competibacteraceae bacterium]MBK7983739.1 signal recognition particle-docking protein FtsY [Candidatus Competibacteraceae bacterium]MBK8897719.1 signal recognition particle-docking protein FtsY [Candidatus Competibacteraceae bacterium]MBK9950750.1 signal recognition particle-docking protein FtsY [Candidatus Competibacteraceae bacterium]
MPESKSNSGRLPPGPAAPERKKSSLFDVLNRPIHLPFRKERPPEGAAESGDGKPFAKLRDRLRRTRKGLVGGLAGLFAGRKLDDETLEELESRLLLADVGVEVTEQLIKRLTERVSRRQLNDIPALIQALRDELLAILIPCQQPWQPSESRPYVILTVGVNGVGKTTTIGKLAKKLQSDGLSVLLAAGDTFRAAAVEQLQVWGERNRIAVIAQHGGADSASVIYDAVQAAKARQVDVVIADTAGRLHTQSNLMEELKKIKRVTGKVDAGAPHEVLLVVDASTGQNALNQAVQFHDAVGVTGLILTKLDGTAKGGIVFAIARRLGLPIRFIGVGEGIEDLREFDAGEFVTALLDEAADNS